MMDIDALYKILGETTTQFRNGPSVRQDGGITEVYAMPHVSEAPPDLDMVDVHFMTIGVDRKKADAQRAAFIDILDHWPHRKALADGPSYLAVGAEIGDQGAALQMFALGHSLGLWHVITPKALFLQGREAEVAAGQGYIMISGWRHDDGGAHQRAE